MSFRIAAKIARRELRGGLSGFRVFLACLILGVAAIAAVGSVRESIRLGLEREGAVILGGHAELEFTYRFAEPEERAWIEAQSTTVSELVDFRSMVVFREGLSAERGLTQVKAVDNNYPLLGRVVLEPPMSLDQALTGKQDAPGAVMAPLLADRLGLKVGDHFRLGNQEFVLGARLLHEPDNAGANFNLGPRTIVKTSALIDSGLIQPGSLFETKYRLLLSDDVDLTALEAAVPDNTQGARWRDRRNGAPGIQTFVDRLSSFLVLVGLAGLAVGGVGISAAVTAYLEKKTSVIAMLKTLGADNRTIFQTYFIQIGVLTVVGLIFGVALGGAIPILLANLLEARLPIPAVFEFQIGPLVEAAMYGALAALIFTLWPLARVEEVRAAALLRGNAIANHRRPRLLWIIATVFLVVIMIGLAGWFSGLWQLTLGAAFGLIVAFVVLVAAARLARFSAKKTARAAFLRGRSALRLALGSIGGPGSEATSVVLSLGLGLTVLAAVGQIDANLRGAIARDLPEVAPSFFMVDIQPDQMKGFRDRLENDPAVSKVDSAPMLRGVITLINGKPAVEVAGEHWVLSGDRGVTYSKEPPEGTKITHGIWWDPDKINSPQISFATEEASEMGLSLGDEITVNILGRDITAPITSLREVDFSTAGIGFIMTMNPGALAGAPHTFISTIYAEDEAEAQILRDISDQYPNITAISVKDAISRVSDVLTGIAAAITYGALATLLTGGVVLIGAAAAGVHGRTYEAAILKTLGANRRMILTSFALRSAFLGLAAGLVAIVAGSVAGWAVMVFVMDTDYVFEPISAIMIVSGGILATLLAGLAFSWAPLAARPAQILSARE